MKHLITRGLALAILSLGIAGCRQQEASVTNDQMEMSSMPSSSALMESEENPATNDEKIANAMTAGIPAIAANAAVMDWPAAEGANPTELRKGTNDWTCLPDNPTSPGNDPICADGNAMRWFQAYMAKEEPTLTQAGIGYMLQGGSDASNTDPFAMEPAPGEDWMNAPPHMMIFPAGTLDAAAYGTTMNGGPWIMWAGTPYEHLMIPVQ